ERRVDLAVLALFDARRQELHVRQRPDPIDAIRALALLVERVGFELAHACRGLRIALVLIDVLRNGVFVGQQVMSRLAGRHEVAHQRDLQGASVDGTGLDRELLAAVFAVGRRDLALPVEDDVDVAFAFAAAVLVPELEWLETGRRYAELAAL